VRVAALYDIHANLPALEAVLRDVRRAGVDQIVAGGDIVPGPMPRETLAQLLDLDIPVRFIYGNGERAVIGQGEALPDVWQRLVDWNAAQIGADYIRILAGWPFTLTLDVDGLGPVLFCHASPRNETEIFTRLTPEARLLPVFAGVDASVVVCGHTHMPFDRTVGRLRVVNAGSVGMPFGPPGADWLLLGPGIEPRHTNYDLDAAAARVRRTTYPQAEEFAARHILEPPSEEQMLQVFSPAEVS
jgi:predicted phosphodiesterase